MKLPDPERCMDEGYLLDVMHNQVFPQTNILTRRKPMKREMLSKPIPIVFIKEQNGDAVRTKETHGVMYHGPWKGERFTMFAESIDPRGDARMISTSPVQKVERVEPCVVRIYTENSTYRIEIGGDCEWPIEEL